MSDEVQGSVGGESSGAIVGAQTESVGSDSFEGGQEGGQQVTPEPLDPGLVSRATTWGMTEEDLRTVPRGVVERILNGADRVMLESYRRTSQTQQPNQTMQPQGTSHGQPVTGAFKPTPFELKFDGEEDGDSPYAKKLAALNSHYHSQMEALHGHYNQQLEQFTQFMQGSQTRQYYDTVDRHVKGWGAGWAKVFGNHSMSELDPRTQEFAKFDALGTAAFEMQQAHMRLTGQMLPESEALRRARDFLYPGKAAEFERAEIDAKRQELRSASSDRPRPSGGQQRNGAVSAVRSRAQEIVANLRR